MKIELIENKERKKVISRIILEALPEWFGIPESTETYIADSENQYLFVANQINNEPIGFICLKETSKDTVEIAVMGVMKDFHNKGVGKILFENSKKLAIERGYSFIQVKTVEMGKYEEYDKTNHFYISLGFKELEIFPTLWDKQNPCQIYIMSIQ